MHQISSFTETADKGSGRMPSNYVPFYLRRKTLLAFTILFVTFIVALEVIFAISNTRHGLSQSSPALRYLMSYGTTGILTATMAFWGRAEYNILRVTPWLKSQAIIEDKNALILDYLDMWRIMVPFQAIKNGHPRVAATATVSLLLNILIVLSTGLFVLESVDIPNAPETLTLQTRFSDDPTRLQNVSSIPNNIVQYFLTNNQSSSGPSNPGVTYLNGVSDDYVYQAFSTTRAGAQEVNVTVDGILPGLDCQQAAVQSISNLELTTAPDTPGSWSSNPQQMIIEHEDCQKVLDFWSTMGQPRPGQQEASSYFQQQYVVDGLARGKCQSTNTDARRFVIASGNVKSALISDRTVLTPENQSQEISTYAVTDFGSIVLVCAPTYELAQVDVVRAATGATKVSRHTGAPTRMLPHVEPWDIMSASLESLSGPEKLGVGAELSIILQQFSETWCQVYCPLPSSIQNATILRDIFTSYYTKHFAAVVHVSLMDHGDITTWGTSRRNEERIIVRPFSCQSMTALLASCTVISLSMAVWPVRGLSLFVDPGPIISTASLSTKTSALNFPKNLGSTSTKNMMGSLLRNKYPYTTLDGPEKSSASKRQSHCDQKASKGCVDWQTPRVLRPTYLIALLIVLALFIGSLEVTLRKSNTHNNQGLGLAHGEYVYLHYAWTALPAVILALLSMWITSMDSQIRTWAPYVLLGHSGQDMTVLSLDLQRGIILDALYREFRSRNFAALAVTASALLGSMFTVATASLFRETMIMPWAMVNLRTTHTLSYSYNPFIEYGGFPSGPPTSLILESNLSYQNPVFQDLVFPTLLLEGSEILNISQTSNTSIVKINATVPALRPGLSCRQASEDILLSVYGLYDNFETYTNYSKLPDSNYQYCFQDTRQNDVNTVGDPVISYFGASTETGTSCFPQRAEHDVMYAWGVASSSPGLPPNRTGWALACNATVEVVDVLVTFLGPTLALDESIPPEPIESTARYVSRPAWANDTSLGYKENSLFVLYQDPDYPLSSLLPMDNTVMDTFFQQLVTSRYAVPIEYLSEASQVENVEKAIIFQHSVIAARYLSESYRRSVGYENGTVGPNVTLFPARFGTPENGNDTGIYPATVTDLPGGSNYVFQDPTATRILQALLVATLVLTLTSWLLGAWKPVLPRPPTSVASVLALLAGGDVLEHMYRDGLGDCESLEDAKSRFADDLRFQLGWGLGANDEPGAPERFGIWIVRRTPVDIDSDDTSVDGEII